MSYEEINEIMMEMGLPFAYYHFSEGCDLTSRIQKSKKGLI